jgi:hypothetical protein
MLVLRCLLQTREQLLLKSSVIALPFDTAKSVVNAFVVARIDYCNSRLAGGPGVVCWA